MAFPLNPALNDLFEADGTFFIWDGEKWSSRGNAPVVPDSNESITATSINGQTVTATTVTAGLLQGTALTRTFKLQASNVETLSRDILNGFQSSTDAGHIVACYHRDVTVNSQEQLYLGGTDILTDGTYKVIITVSLNDSNATFNAVDTLVAYPNEENTPFTNPDGKLGSFNTTPDKQGNVFIGYQQGIDETIRVNVFNGQSETWTGKLNMVVEYFKFV